MGLLRRNPHIRLGTNHNHSNFLFIHAQKHLNVYSVGWNGSRSKIKKISFVRLKKLLQFWWVICFCEFLFWETAPKNANNEMMAFEMRINPIQDFGAQSWILFDSYLMLTVWLISIGNVIGNGWIFQNS